MNVLFVTPGFSERRQPTTGFPNYLYRVSLSLIRLGHKPFILTAGNKNAHQIERGIDIRTIQIFGYADYKSQAANYVLNALHKGFILNKEINKLIKELHIDVIQFTSLEGIAIFYHGNIPAVLRLSSYAKTAFPDVQTHSLKTVKAMAFMERCSSKRCVSVFAPSRKNAKIFGEDIKRKVKVIETPFINDVKTYDNSFVDTYLKGKKYVLFFGTLYAEKGILVIAEILRKFLKENADYNFVFIGDTVSIKGKNSAKILQNAAKECADRVLIEKAIPHEQLYPVIRHSDFVVLPSVMENMSNACIEAMYFERIVIGTDGASFEQLITHGENGLLCKIGDSGDLLEKMQMAVSMDAEQKQHMGKEAKKRIDRLKPEYTVKKLIRLYEYVTTNASQGE